MSTPTKLISYEDSLKMPENRIEEIVHGESRVMPPNRSVRVGCSRINRRVPLALKSQRTCSGTARRLRAHRRAGGLAARSETPRFESLRFESGQLRPFETLQNGAVAPLLLPNVTVYLAELWAAFGPGGFRTRL